MLQVMWFERDWKLQVQLRFDRLLCVGLGMRGLARRWVGQGILAAAILVGAGSSLHAQQMSTAEYEGLFRQTLNRPSDLALNLRFADAAIARKDYEAAIGTFERLLFYNPGNADVQFQLGRLYFQLESKQVARNYFEGAANAAGASAEVRNQSRAYLAQIDGIGNKPWSLYAAVGARYQTNANSGPNNLFIRVLGQNQPVLNQSSKTPDWNAFAVVAGSYAHVFNERNDALEFNIAGYYGAQARLTNLSLGVVDLQIGPRFQLPAGFLSNASVRGYAIGTYTSLGGSTYFSGPGAGLSLRHDIGPVAVEHFGEYRRKIYENSTDYPLATQQTGDLWSYVLQTSGTITGDVRWLTRFTLARNEANTSFNAFNAVAFDVAFPIDVGTPFGLGSGSWSLAPTIGVSDTRYDGPDPSVDPGVTRHDFEWRIGARLDIPVYQNIGIMAQLQYSRVNSTVPNYDSNNFSVSFGSTLKF